MSDALTSAKGSLYIQRHAYDAPQYVGQVSLDALVEPRGDITVVQARSFTNGDIETEITARAAPGGVPVVITALTFPGHDLIDLIGDCEVTLYVTQDCQGRHGVLDAYDRCYILHHVACSKVTRDGLVHMTADVESTRKLEFMAGTPIYEVGHVEDTSRVATTSANDWLDIAAWRFRRCSSTRGYEQGWCDYRVAITEVPAGPGTAKVWYSTDGGATWTITANDPFAAGIEISACAIFPIDEDTIRILVTRYSDGFIAYSDNFGATAWTHVEYETYDPLAQCHGTYNNNALFCLDGHNIWIVVDCSHIGTSNVYVSYTGGETWEALGTVSDDAKSIFFCDPNNGFMGAGDGRIYATTDGGLTWTQAADTGAGYEFYSIFAFDTKHVLAGANAGFGLYETFDGWVTWDRPIVNPTLIIANEVVADIYFYNEFCGFILSYNSGGTARLYWSMDGGRSWHYYDPGLNILRAMVVCGQENAMAVGDVDAGTAAIVETIS